MNKEATMKSIKQVEDAMDAMIARVGWAVQAVFPRTEGDGPPFCYTVGLAAKGLPELIIFGLPLQVGGQFLNMVARDMVDGKMPSLDTDLNDYAENCPARLLPAPRSATDQYMFATESRYPGYTALQMVWPDSKGRWPWEPAFEERFVKDQPVLRDMAQ